MFMVCSFVVAEVRIMPGHQLCFPFEPAPPRSDRLFFAILAPEDSASTISICAKRLRAEHGLKSKLIASERLHISLFSLGDYAGLPEPLVALARKAGALVSRPEFDVTFDSAASFNGRHRKRPLVLYARKDIAEILAFHRLLGEAMKQVGLVHWGNPRFTPHMTLLYESRAVMEQAIEPVRLTVRDFVLVHSFIGQSRYEEVARWRLGA
jgi:2'-5' RNA ligase